MRTGFDLAEARNKMAQGKQDYNGERPPSRWGDRTPNKCAEVLKSSVMIG
jgi:hypothetical protein